MTEPAIFLRKETAELIGARFLQSIAGALGFAVRPYKRRGQMQGYTVTMRFREGYIEPITEQQFANLTGA